MVFQKALFTRLHATESGGNPYAKSQTGALGMFQFTGLLVKRLV